MPQLPIATRADEPAVPAPDGTASITEAALRAELAKWRERVPKLAAALRQRTAEVARLRGELEAGAAQPGGAGTRAREELISELEGRLTDLKERCKSAQAELHKRQLDIDELRSEAEGWKRKWQAVTHTLDEQSQAAEQHERRIATLETERDDARRELADAVEQYVERKGALQQALSENESLRARNEQLFETTEMANRQIEALSDTIAALRAERDQAREQAAAAPRELAESRRAREVAEAALAEARAAAAAEVAAAQSAAADLRREAERLAGVVEDAQKTVADREQERRALSEQLQALELRQQHLEQQLADRSQLVVTLERDQAAGNEAMSRLRDERDELEAACLRAERHAREHAEHIAALDAKLERQQALMVDLEAELADANRAQAEAQRPAPPAAAGDGAELSRLQQQVRKLEQTVRERTEEINQLQWQRQLAAEQASGTRGASDTPDEQGDDKLVVVLNQQLTDARARNSELLERVRALEIELAGGRRPEAVDELTLIHGVGRKLAGQLRALGIRQLRQIAELDPGQLDDPGHILHLHRSRVLRDQWIEQAAKLLQA